MSAKHTPGPWKADGYQIRQSGKTGTRMIADIGYTGPHHTPPDEYPESCRHVDEANAILIAAAPELLELAERCEMWLGTIHGGRKMQMECRKVITKAKGGQS